jgi:N-glycosylase/DNA lyase
MTRLALQRIESAVSQIGVELQIKFESESVEPLSERVLWLELSCCILSSQVPYELAQAAARRIDEEGLLRGEAEQEQDERKLQIQQLLKRPLVTSTGQKRYRFPNVRGQQLAAAYEASRWTLGTLQALTSTGALAPAEARRQLVANVPGCGPKQASMFLRNVGVTRELAILDRHVARYMTITGLASTMPKSFSRVSLYEEYEALLKSRADYLGFQVGTLDWAIWIVMRVLSRIEPRCPLSH